MKSLRGIQAAALALALTSLPTRCLSGWERGTGCPPDDLPSTAPSKWPTPVVIIPAHYKSWHGPRPPWESQLPSFASLFIYQRVDPEKPNYVFNGAPSGGWGGGYEAGVHLHFLAQHYDNLPDVMIFTQDMPAEHSANFFPWLRCLKPETLTFTSFSDIFIQDRVTSKWRHKSKNLGAVVEQCWRNMLNAFHLGELVKPRDEPHMSGYCCAQFAVSKAAVLRYPRESFCTARHLMADGVGNWYAHPPVLFLRATVCGKVPLTGRYLWPA